MTRLTRKQREIQDREQNLLVAAREILNREGYAAITMDRLAVAVEYSKGTVYQHFSGREDVLAAIAEQAHAYRLQLFERAVHFRGRSHERLCAIGVADFLASSLRPEQLRAEPLAAMSGSTRIDVRRESRATLAEEQCIELCLEVVREAQRSGDLVLRGSHSARDLVTALEGLSFGMQFLGGVAGRKDHASELDRALSRVVTSGFAMMVGFGWRLPIRGIDWASLQSRVQKEVFATEFQQLGLGSGA